MIKLGTADAVKSCVHFYSLNGTIVRLNYILSAHVVIMCLNPLMKEICCRQSNFTSNNMIIISIPNFKTAQSLRPGAHMFLWWVVAHQRDIHGLKRTRCCHVIVVMVMISVWDTPSRNPM